MAKAIVSTVRPKASETPNRPMPASGNAAAKTALPQPPRTSQARGIAVDSQGRIFVADFQNSCVDIIDEYGNLIGRWDEYDPWHLVNVMTLAIDEFDNVFVSDQTQCIKVDRNGNVLTRFVEGMACTGLDVFGADTLYTVDAAADTGGADRGRNPGPGRATNELAGKHGVGPPGLSAVSLAQNVPNPFNPGTEIAFRLDRDGVLASLEVYGMDGSLVRRLIDEVPGAGPHSVRWDGCDDAGRRMPSGGYIYRLQPGDFIQTKRMTLLTIHHMRRINPFPSGTGRSVCA